jgi:sigma-54 specific flagellar transcriptional regulator A
MNYIIGDQDFHKEVADKMLFCFGFSSRHIPVEKCITHEFHKNDTVFLQCENSMIDVARSVRAISKYKCKLVLVGSVSKQIDSKIPLSSIAYPLKFTEFVSLNLGKPKVNPDRSSIIIGESNHTKNILSSLEQISACNSTVLVLGESGVGKEVVSNAIHYGGTRKNMPFVAINCGAIPENLMESELFGYKKGSFTGAFANKIGKFEEANGGTLFLDEIGELPLSMQTKLLRVLQEKVVQQIGSSVDTVVDVRIIAATNSNLKELVAEKKFREDLYYRLNVIPLNIRPLRDRVDDIKPLLNHAASEKFNFKLSVDDGGMDVFLAHSWPGNVRELINVVERISVFFKYKTLNSKDVQDVISGVDLDLSWGEDDRATSTSSDSYSSTEKNVLSLKDSLLDYEKKLITEALDESGGVMKDVCIRLGVKRTTMLEKMKRLELTS